MRIQVKNTGYETEIRDLRARLESEVNKVMQENDQRLANLR
jgi:hypothetical protein